MRGKVSEKEEFAGSAVDGVQFHGQRFEHCVCCSGTAAWVLITFVCVGMEVVLVKKIWKMEACGTKAQPKRYSARCAVNPRR